MIDKKAKPFLKWAGGKRSLLSDLFKFIPTKYNTYFEPFLGSGALFFSLRPKKAYLFDINNDLINAYSQIKRNPDEVIKHLKNMKYEKRYYYKIRAQKSKSSTFRAARLIYLNRTCWNGLYRVNSKEEFNVPFGAYKNPLICDIENLAAVSIVLKNAVLKAADFAEILKYVLRNDFIYLDPPYTVSHRDNGFISYNSKIFSLDDQMRLKNMFVALDNKGCKVLMSNADHAFIKNLYKDYDISIIERKSLIASDTKNRKLVTESVIKNF